MIDANEARGQKSGVDAIMHECCLIDAHAKTSDTSPAPATHQRGSEKIDFILVSPRIAKAITSASILALQDGYYSDHRALMDDFDARELFGSDTSEVTSQATRRLTSTSPRAVSTYIAHMKKHMSLHRIVEKATALDVKSKQGMWSATEIIEYEKLDSLLQEGRAAAENKCKPRDKSNYPWSPDLEKAGTAALYWKM